MNQRNKQGNKITPSLQQRKKWNSKKPHSEPEIITCSLIQRKSSILKMVHRGSVIVQWFWVGFPSLPFQMKYRRWHTLLEYNYWSKGPISLKITNQVREETKPLSYIINRNFLLQMQFFKLEYFIILILSFNDSKYWFNTNPNILKVYHRSFGYKPYSYWERFFNY